MNDAITGTLESIQKFLRYVAPGFVFLGLVAFIYPSALDFLEASPVIAATLGLLAGVTLNSLHVALIEDLIAFLIYTLYRRLPLLNRLLLEDMRTLDAMQIWREIEEQRLRRRYSADGPAQRFQSNNDSLAATLTFLYCSSYPGFLVAIFQVSRGEVVDLLALGSAVVFLLFGLACDVRYVQLELWAMGEFELGRQAATDASSVSAEDTRGDRG